MLNEILNGNCGEETTNLLNEIIDCDPIITKTRIHTSDMIGLRSWNRLNCNELNEREWNINCQSIYKVQKGKEPSIHIEGQEVDRQTATQRTPTTERDSRDTKCIRNIS